MTNPTTPSRMIAADLERISADLAAANEDVALLERLKSANDRVERLTAEQEKATKDHGKALAAETKAADATRFAGLSNVSVIEAPETARENVIRSTWTIHYTRPVWDGRTSRLRQLSSVGFGSLDPQVLAYLMDKRPDLIPTKILALAPDSPAAAFRRYFISLKRGHVVGQ